MEYDLNNDGVNEVFHVNFWDRWNAVIFDLIINDKTYHCSSGSTRVGISSEITNGFHDIVLDDDNFYKWNGNNYTSDDDEFIIQ